MINRFIKYIEKEKLFNKDDKLIVAVSGGKDSMALLHLLLHTGFENVFVAHCNYQLRGEASNLDETLVFDYCKTQGIPFECKRFDMRQEMDQGQSTQMKARALRYEWFESLLGLHNSEHLLLGHHLLDNIETVLMNLFRGTGIKGIRGMKVQHEYKVRPLLNFSQEEIKTYVEENNVPYRDDQSNFSNDYLRNSIRHKLLPIIEELFPSYENNMEKSIENLRAIDQSYDFLLAKLTKTMISEDQDGSILIAKQALSTSSSRENILHAILFDKGFSRTQILNINASMTSIGARFHTGQQELLVERDHLRLQTIDEVEELNIAVHHSETTDTANGSFSLEKVPYESALKAIESKAHDRNTEFISLSNSNFTLTLRNWKPGDYFHPLGMKGKKKIQDFFTDLKIENATKGKVPILVNEKDEIVWVVSYRLDDRFKLDPLKACYKISWKPLVNSLL